MRGPGILICALLALAACREDQAALPGPVAITAESAGYYCQMGLLEHVGPKGQIHLDGLEAPIFFSQVRDVIAYLHMPEQSHAVLVSYVQDMSGATWAEPGPWIPAEQAYYVIGSDMSGGMEAPEFVPFSDPDAARAFVVEHGGRMRSFADITAREALAPAVSGPGALSDPDGEDMSARLRALDSKERTTP